MAPKKSSQAASTKEKQPAGTPSRQIDYSMPRQNGLFIPPPYTYPKMRAIIVVFQCAPGVKEKFLPPELTPIEYGLDSIFIAEYPNSSIGPYHENLILLQCEYKGEPGSFVYNIYVDDDAAFAAGREIWGFPKKMCNISLSQPEKGMVRGTLTRKGVDFLDVQVELMDKPPGMDPKTMLENMPIYNLKLIPDVADNSKPVLRQLTVTNMKYNNFTTSLGAKTNYVRSKFSQHDTCHEILKDAKTDMGGIYIKCDQILPNGSVLE
nr:acetoacetate decarboxylase family protein [Candidatus Sigynarchaeum springense]